VRAWLQAARVAALERQQLEEEARAEAAAAKRKKEEDYMQNKKFSYEMLVALDHKRAAAAQQADEDCKYVEAQKQVHAGLIVPCSVPERASAP
jgi:hypothetical protein